MSICGVIVAAGLSSRMGRFKPLLPLGDGTIIDSAVASVKRAGALYIVVVTGHNGEMLRRRLSGSGVVFAHNPEYAQTQMFDSLLIGFEKLPEDCERVFIMPADVPLVTDDTFRRLLETDAPAARPVYCGKSGHPLLLSAALLPKITSYGGEGGMQGAISALGFPVLDVPVEDEGVLLDADTPEDYERLLKLVTKRSGK